MTALYTVEDAAIFLCVTGRTIRNLIAKKALRIVRVGRCIRLREEDIKTFLNQHTSK